MCAGFTDLFAIPFALLLVLEFCFLQPVELSLCCGSDICFYFGFYGIVSGGHIPKHCPMGWCCSSCRGTTAMRLGSLREDWFCEESQSTLNN